MFKLLDNIIYGNESYTVYGIGYGDDNDVYIGIGSPDLIKDIVTTHGKINGIDLWGYTITKETDKLKWVYIRQLYKDNIRSIPFESIKDKSKEILEFMYDHRIESVEYELNNNLCIKYKYDINKKIFSMYIDDIEVISSNMPYDIINFK